MTLLIALAPPTPDNSAPGEYRYAVSDDGLTIASQGVAPAALLPRTRGEIVAVLPTTALSWHALKLPQLPRATGPARLRAVLEGLLEEHVLDDPATLHIALEPGRHTGQPAGHAVWAACCDKAWLAGQLQQLEQEGVSVTRLLPAARPLAAAEAEAAADRVLLAGTPEQPRLEIARAQGLWVLPVRSAQEVQQALSIAGLPALAEAAGADPEAGQPQAPAEPGAAPARPAAVFLAEPAVAALAEKWLPQPAALRAQEQGWLECFAADDDLAQFDLRLNSRSLALRRWRKLGARLWHAPQWRPARVGLMALAAAQLIGLNAWAWVQQRQLQGARQDVEAVLTQAFPQVRVVIDAPLQMAREVAALRQAAGQTSPQDLEAMLAALATALPQAQRLQQLSFSPGELRFGGSPLSAEDLADAQDALAPAGLRLQPGGAQQWILTSRPAGFAGGTP